MLGILLPVRSFAVKAWRHRYHRRVVRLVEHAARTPVKIITVRLCQQVGIVEMENDGTGCVVVQLPPWLVPRKASKLGVG